MKIQLNKICFGLPTKSFFIDYTVNKKRELPVVKEFVIRLIYFIGTIDLDTIQVYFGLSNKEILAIIENLHEENLIEWENSNVKLTYYAISKFTDDDGELRPTFFEVTDESSSVQFELYNFRMLHSDVSQSGRLDYSLSLNLPDESYRNILDKAQNAFDHNFNLFREVVLKENVFSEVKELYKINHVSHRYDSTLAIEVEYYIDTQSPNQLNMKYVSSDIDEWDEDKSFFTLIDSIIETNSNRDQHISFNQYLEESEDPFIGQYWDDKSQEIDINKLLLDYEKGLTKINDDTFMMVGNFYTDNNREILINGLVQKIKNKSDSSGLIWFTNSESKTWGKVSDLNLLIDGIHSLFDKKKNTSKIVLCTVCHSLKESNNIKDHLKKLTNTSLIDFPEHFIGEDSEFLIIPNIMIASLFHLKFNDDKDIPLPIGYISFEPEKVNKFSTQLLEWVLDHPTQNFFEHIDTEDENIVKNKYLIPILNQ